MSMPCIGRSSFLRGICGRFTTRMSNVSMPYAGRSSFLQFKYELRKHLTELCQCPMSGVLHFYHECRAAPLKLGKCVNALCRAFFISTIKQLEFEKAVLLAVSMPYVGRSSFLHSLWELLKS